MRGFRGLPVRPPCRPPPETNPAVPASETPPSPVNFVGREDEVLAHLIGPIARNAVIDTPFRNTRRI